MTLRVHWEGEFFSRHSLALVNRELVLHLAARGDVGLTLTPRDGERRGGGDPRARRLRALVGEGRDPDVWVRHAWPLDPHPPRAGKWVAIQPWEYGGIPLSFYEPLRFGVDELWVPSSFNRFYYVDSGIPEERIRVVPNGVAPVFLTPAGAYPLRTRKRFKFLFVGGTILRKGIDLLVDAYVRTFGPEDDVCLVVKDFGVASHYSGRTYDHFIREMQRDPSRPEIEYITDELTPGQLRDLYAACDCLVHPYRGEGFGLPIAEAMACGLPVVVPDEGASSDYCTAETAVLLRSERRFVPIAGSWEMTRRPWWIEPSMADLKERMREIYENPGSVAELAARGRAWVRENLTWERAARLAGEGLHEVAARDAPPRHRDAARQGEERLLEGVHAWSRAAPLEALRHFGVGRAHVREHVDLEYNLATVLVAREDYRTAAPVLEGLVERAARESDDALAAQALVLLGGCEHSRGRAREAVAVLERAQRHDPRNADALALLPGVRQSAARAGTADPLALAERPRVRWRGAIFNATGYGDEARNFTLGLHALGWDLHLAPHDLVQDAGVVEPMEFRRLVELTRGPGDGYGLDVQHVAAHLATPPAAGRSVIRTMFETDRISADWVDTCNGFTEVWVPTEFNRETFARSGVVEEKLRVVPGSLDTRLYDPAHHRPLPLPGDGGFRFLSLFDWTPRKGWEVLLTSFVEEFEPDEPVTLVVKSTDSQRRTSPERFIREYLEERGYRRTPRIEVIERDLSPRDLLGLYLACDAFVLPSRGEGWGRPYMEAMALGRPVIGTRWSGNLAFMDDANSYLIEIEDLEPADRQQWAHYLGHRWARPSVRSTRERMREVYSDRAGAAARGARARADIVARYDRMVVARQVDGELRRLAGS